MDFPPPLPPKARNYDRIIIGAAIVFTLAGLGVAGFGGVMLFRNIKARREALAGLRQTTAAEQAKMPDTIKNGNGAEQVGRMKDQLGKSASQLSGTDADVMHASASFLGKLQAAMRDYEASRARLKQEKILTFHIRDRETIEAHRQIVRDFLASNARLLATFQNAENLYRAELETAQIPLSVRAGVMTRYSASQALQLPLVTQVRHCDRTLGETALATLDLLDQNWGKWNIDEANGRLRFQDNATLATYNTFMQKIQAAGVDQRKAQDELIARTKPTPVP